MSQIRQQQAYERGARTAHLWKKFKDSVLHWDRRCTAWANKKSLPLWVGHVPVIVALLGSLTIILLGGAVIAGCLLFIWAIAFILQNTDFSNMQMSDSSTNESVDDDGYQNGAEGFGNYVGGTRIDNK
ncbi:DUF3742 family protein [Serratia quinivorans]|jgi:hypothetical protein|uniref:DUF3742 family protein n=1 Tax=Serratia quinivorans TaxID=137545 RepID=A0ABV3UP30_9GAMM